jgi:hypothetical protein
MGNMKTKELPALSSPTIASVFKERLEQMRETISQPANSQSGFETTWAKVLKPHSSAQKSLEALHQEIKRVLKAAASGLSELPPTEISQKLPITNEDTRLILLTLLSFHPEKKMMAETSLTVTLMKSQP